MQAKGHGQLSVHIRLSHNFEHHSFNKNVRERLLKMYRSQPPVFPQQRSADAEVPADWVNGVPPVSLQEMCDEFVRIRDAAALEAHPDKALGFAGGDLQGRDGWPLLPTTEP